MPVTRSRRLRPARSAVVVAAGALAVALVAALPVRAWSAPALQGALGMDNTVAEALFETVGGWGGPVSWSWVLCGLLALALVDHAERPPLRRFLWGAATAVVALRVAVQADDRFAEGPSPWWHASFAVALLLAGAAVVALAAGARTEAGLLVLVAVPALTVPRPDPELPLSWVPLQELPPMPSAVAGLAVAGLLHLLLRPGARTAPAVVPAVTATAVLVAAVGLVAVLVGPLLGRAPWLWTAVDELSPLVVPLVVLTLAPLVAAGRPAGAPPQDGPAPGTPRTPRPAPRPASRPASQPASQP